MKAGTQSECDGSLYLVVCLPQERRVLGGIVHGQQTREWISCRCDRGVLRWKSGVKPPHSKKGVRWPALAGPICCRRGLRRLLRFRRILHGAFREMLRHGIAWLGNHFKSCRYAEKGTRVRRFGCRCFGFRPELRRELEAGEGLRNRPALRLPSAFRRRERSLQVAGIPASP